MHPKTIIFLATAILVAASRSATAVDSPPASPIGIVIDVTGTPTPVPPVIDIGVVKPGRPQTLTQPFLNNTGSPLVIQSAAVLAGDFSASLDVVTTVPDGGTFNVLVTAEGEGSGPIEGTLEIQLAGGLAWGIALEAYVDLVDAEAPLLALASTGFESGTAAPFGTPAMYPAPPVSATAALAGAKGVAIPHTGSTTPSYLHYFFPDTRKLARATFQFDPNSLGILANNPETIAGFYDYGLPIAWLELRRNREVFQLRVHTRLDNGTTGTSGWVNIPDAPQTLTFDWWAGEAGNFEGGVRVRCGQGGVAEYRSTALNYSRIRHARVGAVAGVSSSVVGHWYLDDLRVAY